MYIVLLLILFLCIYIYVQCTYITLYMLVNLNKIIIVVQ